MKKDTETTKVFTKFSKSALLAQVLLQTQLLKRMQLKYTLYTFPEDNGYLNSDIYIYIYIYIYFVYLKFFVD